MKRTIEVVNGNELRDGSIDMNKRLTNYKLDFMAITFFLEVHVLGFENGCI